MGVAPMPSLVALGAVLMVAGGVLVLLQRKHTPRLRLSNIISVGGVGELDPLFTHIGQIDTARGRLDQAIDAVIPVRNRQRPRARRARRRRARLTRRRASGSSTFSRHVPAQAAVGPADAVRRAEPLRRRDPRAARRPGRGRDAPPSSAGGPAAQARLPRRRGALGPAPPARGRARRERAVRGRP